MYRTSSGLNSTLQPIADPGGGGLNLIVFQLVVWMFCKVNSFVNACMHTRTHGHAFTITNPQAGYIAFHNLCSILEKAKVMVLYILNQLAQEG